MKKKVLQKQIKEKVKKRRGSNLKVRLFRRSRKRKKKVKDPKPLSDNPLKFDFNLQDGTKEDCWTQGEALSDTQKLEMMIKLLDTVS